jgi:hypothetical protein
MKQNNRNKPLYPIKKMVEFHRLVAFGAMMGETVRRKGGLFLYKASVISFF